MSEPRNTYPTIHSVRDPNYWKLIADQYDQLYDVEAPEYLRDYAKDEHALLTQTVSRLGGNERSVVVLEVGSGTGRALFRLAAESDLAGRVSYFVGIDNAGTMVGIARFKLRAISHRQRSKIYFLELAGQRLGDFFDCGSLNAKQLLRQHEGSLEGFKPQVFDGASKLFCALFNTLGIMEREERSQVLQGMIEACGTEDLMAISVAAADSFREKARHVYGSLGNLLGPITPNSFDDKSSTFKTERYYSHWFEAEDIAKELESRGCKVLSVQRIDAGGHFITASRIQPLS